MNKNHILGLLILNIIVSSYSKNIDYSEKKAVFYFQDFFENDTISFMLNDCLIIENEIITSDETGFAETLEINNETSKFKKKKMNFNCWNSIFHKNHVSVLLNGNKVNFEIDFCNGIYIGFNKTGNNNLYLEQSTIPLSFE